VLTDLEHLGQSVVNDGRLVQLRTRLQFSRSSMAELLNVAPGTFVRWEKFPRTVLHRETASRVGEVYQRALQEIVWLREDGVRLDSLIPFYLVAARLGWPQEYLLAKYRTGDIPGVDLGILGPWMSLEICEDLARSRRKHVAA
jgi:DNA-binding XRE family transcriptional regulator